ncbi:hypothetical protein [Nocardia transvalensis]|uniref:hypothetical protein n=1 Tax=Nocardia transvalensis TaxID=37333 RepID=UPI0018930855|nr:hypothetical protein [Nocardia transvalensis]MBF6328321.1 hypothetical protein [Nocardia transvalensis]
MATVLVTGAQLQCGHGPITVNSSAVLRVGGHPVLRESDFAQADFKACAASTPPGKCTKFGPFTAGLSTVLQVGGERVVLATADAAITPGGKLLVTQPGQTVLDAK